MPLVYIKLPKTGLGNMLLVWAKGIVFAHVNQLSYSTSSWWGLRWGALLRFEKRNRLYFGYFKEPSISRQLADMVRLRLSKVQFDPAVQRRDANERTGIFVFKQVISGEDLFGDLRAHDHFIKTSLDALLTRSMKERLSRLTPPMISMHIRRGDFVLGNQTTPLTFFTCAVKLIRQAYGEEYPITIFTDAHVSELKELLDLPAIKLADSNPDILDILLMSQSSILVLSKSSTFSYWAAFLSEAAVIRPHDDWQPMLKQNSEGHGYAELKLNPLDEQTFTPIVRQLKCRSNFPVRQSKS